MKVNSLSLFVLFCGVLLAVIAVYSWRRRFVRGAMWFSLFMLAVSVYVTGYFFELSSIDLPAMLFWNKVQYFGILLLSPFCLLFALHFAQRTAIINRWLLALIFLIPTIFFGLKLFDDSLHLVYQDVRINTSGAIPLLAFTPGPIYYFTAIYNLILLAYGVFQIWTARTNSSPLFRKQTSIMVGTWVVIYAVYVIYLSGFRPFPFLQNIDFNPFGFTAWALAITYAILRYRLFDLVPFAREKLIETLSEGVLVFDAQNRLVDANPASREIFGWEQNPIGMVADRVFGGWLGSGEAEIDFQKSIQTETGSIETIFRREGKKYWFDINVTVLRGRDDEIEGRLLVLHDITARKRIEQELHDLSLEDELTGLKNRRGFFTLASQMLEMILRIELSAALVYIDLDGLKTINDTLGHSVGDRAIITVGRSLREKCRSSDILARIGGDEFIILAIGSEKNLKKSISQRLETILESLQKVDGFPSGLSFSYGIVAYSPGDRSTLEEMLVEADRIMYEQKLQKKSGREDQSMG